MNKKLESCEQRKNCASLVKKKEENIVNKKNERQGTKIN